MSGQSTEKTLIESEATLRGILETAADAIITIDRRGIVKRINPATEKMFGYSQDELLGENVKILMPPPYCDEHDSYIARYLDTAKAHIIGVGRELVARRRDGSRFFVDLSVSEAKNLGLFTGVIRDVGARKRAEEALRREHDFAEQMIETAQNIVLVLDAQGQVVRFNSYMETLTGWRFGDVRGRDWFDVFVPARDRSRARSFFEASMAGEKVHGNTNSILTKDGLEREIQWHDSLLSEVTGELIGLLCIGVDVTERRMLEREILEVASEEQRRIGQELHDGVQQQLIGLGLIAHSALDSIDRLGDPGDGPPSLEKGKDLAEPMQRIRETLAKVTEGIDEAARRVHGLARGLIPVEVGPQGLVCALEELTRSLDNVGTMTCRFSDGEPIDVSSRLVATHLYRIAQEALSNALKHSRGTKIDISLHDTEGQIVLKVQDDGVGFEDPETLDRGLGIHLMRYRAELIGGALRVERSEGGGISVVCTVPRKF